MWAASSAAVSLVTETATGEIPAVSSLIVTINEVGNLA